MCEDKSHRYFDIYVVIAFMSMLLTAEIKIKHELAVIIDIYVITLSYHYNPDAINKYLILL
jgi:hypothetical protein